MSSASLDNFRSFFPLMRYVLTAIIGLSLDLWTKWYAFEKLVYDVVRTSDGSRVIARPPFRLIPGWLEFNAHTNDGAVFGLGQGQRWLFVLISLAAIAFLTFLFAASQRQRFYQFILGLLLAGVLGNLYDRVRYAYVRDMIHALPSINWPGTQQPVFPWIFNVADSLLCVGVSLMILYSLMHDPRDHPAATVSE